jgi:hypothetical protein
MLSRIHKQEEGVAIITAVLTSAIVVLLGTTVVQLAVHNSEGSAYDRRHVQSIAAAEAGIDFYFSALAETGGLAPECSISGTMQSSPGAFTVTPIFYDAVGVPLLCPPPVDPSAVLLHSVGTSGPASSARTMEAYAELTVSTGGTFDNAGAIIADSTVAFTSNATIGGNNFSDADVYTNGNITLASNSTLYGKIFAQGSVTMSSGAEVKKDVWTKGGITMAAGASIRGNATAGEPAPAAPSNISMANNSHIYGNATASGTVTGGVVDGTRTQNQTTVAAPPTRPYPTFTYNPAHWTSGGFTSPGDFTSCSAAETYIRSTWTSGNLLVRITVPGSTCTLTFTNNNYTVKGNLAIISDGPVTLNTNARFAPTAGQTYNVFLIAGLSGVAPCNITMNTNSGFGPGLPTLLYTPSTCTTNLHSNTAITQGQILSGSINFHHTSQFQYSRLTVPGTGTGGFKQDVVYKREVVD